VTSLRFVVLLILAGRFSELQHHSSIHRAIADWQARNGQLLYHGKRTTLSANARPFFQSGRLRADVTKGRA